MVFHSFVQRHRMMAVAVAVSAASTMTAAGCGTATSSASGPAASSTAATTPAASVPAASSPGASSTAASGPTVIVVRDNANGKAVSARAGDRIELILSSSYWHVTGSSAPGVLRQDGAAVLLSRPSTCPDIPGLGCIPVRADFSALTDGQAVITAGRTSCGEAMRCQPGQTQFAVTIVIRN